MKLADKIKIYNRNKISDSRGWFLKVINGKEKHLPSFTGEVYLISATAGECRANHYHHKANEWFTLVKGEALILLEDIETNEKMEIELNEDYPQTIYVPSNIAHAFKNIGKEDYILVTYTDLLYSPEDTVSFIL